MVHDFYLTAAHVVFMDLPVVFDREIAKTAAGGPAYRWDEGYLGFVGLLICGFSASASTEHQWEAVEHVAHQSEEVPLAEPAILAHLQRSDDQDKQNGRDDNDWS
jgi:hypothetical protein